VNVDRYIHSFGRDVNVHQLSRVMNVDRYIHEFRRVTDAGREVHCALVPQRIALEEVAVFLHGGAAPSGVDRDVIRSRALERRDGRARHFPRSILESGVKVERAATALAFGYFNVPAAPREHANRRPVDIAEHRAHDAACEERNAAA
jgi:hypothetical protein